MHEVRPYAQNILQLHSQFRAAGVSDADQVYLAGAHRMAAALFSGQIRGSGKPFLEHLVGTASILVSCQTPAPLVAAGLLHAAYDAGDFGLGVLGRHRHRKSEIVRTVGADAEDYIWRYHGLRWTTESLPSLAAAVGTLPARDRSVVLIRLANELEEHLDCGIQFCANGAQRMARVASLGPLFVEMAQTIGQPGLADELSAAFAENCTTPIPDELRSTTSYSFLEPPRSYGRRWTVRLRSYAAGLAARTTAAQR